MERGAHTHIYTSTLSRRERAWRGRRRYWLRFTWSAVTVLVALGVALSGLVVHLV